MLSLSDSLHAIHETTCTTRKLECGLQYPDEALLVGPIFFEGTKNSKHFCSVLHDFIGLLEEDEISYFWFQLDL